MIVMAVGISCLGFPKARNDSLSHVVDKRQCQLCIGFLNFNDELQEKVRDEGCSVDITDHLSIAN